MTAKSAAKRQALLHAAELVKQLIIGPALIAVALVWCASAQTTTYSATTESRDLIWNGSTRVTRTRVEANGRTIETQVVEAPSINRGYALVSATEKETIRDGPNTVRVVERFYVPDPDGHHQLSQITEGETTTVPGKGTNTIRTRYDIGLDGHRQAMERQVEESVSLNASTRRSTSTLFQVVAGALTPVRQTVTIETHKENGLTDVQRTVSLPDGSGRFIAMQVTHSAEEQAADGSRRAKEENVLQTDAGTVLGQGQMAAIQRTVTQEWKDSEGQHSLASTYSRFTEGIAPDGQLHLNRQVARVEQVADNGDTQLVEDMKEKNPGSIADPPRPSIRMIEITHYGAGGEFETRTITQAPGSSGAMETIATSNTRGWKRGNE